MLTERFDGFGGVGEDVDVVVVRTVKEHGIVRIILPAVLPQQCGLDAVAQAAVGEADVTALEPSLLRASQPLELLGGQVHVETRDPVVIQTPLAEIRLRAILRCTFSTVSTKSCVLALCRDNVALPR